MTDEKLETASEAKIEATTDATTREFANSVRTAASGWIGSADAKAAALVAVAGAIFAIVITGTASVSANLRIVELLIVALFSLSMTCSIIGAAAVLWPRTNREKLLREGGHDKPLESSPTYFGDLAKKSFAEFEKMAKAPPTNDIQDPLEQAYVMAKIASKKMRCMKAAVFFLVLSMLFLGALIIVEASWRWCCIS